jgi:hypothetical protein
MTPRKDGLPKKKKDKNAENKRIQRELKIGLSAQCPPHRKVNTEINSSGRKFKECDKCGAFLGWAK